MVHHVENAEAPAGIGPDCVEWATACSTLQALTITLVGVGHAPGMPDPIYSQTRQYDQRRGNGHSAYSIVKVALSSWV